MPTYDAKCDKCGHIWEETVAPHSPAGMCPECYSAYTSRIWTRVPVLDRAKDPYEYLEKSPPTNPTKVFIKRDK